MLFIEVIIFWSKFNGIWRHFIFRKILRRSAVRWEMLCKIQFGNLCEQINMETLLKCGNIPSQKSGIAFKSCSNEKTYTMTNSVRSFFNVFLHLDVFSCYVFCPNSPVVWQFPCVRGRSNCVRVLPGYFHGYPTHEDLNHFSIAIPPHHCSPRMWPHAVESFHLHFSD